MNVWLLQPTNHCRLAVSAGLAGALGKAVKSKRCYKVNASAPPAHVLPALPAPPTALAPPAPVARISNAWLLQPALVGCFTRTRLETDSIACTRYYTCLAGLLVQTNSNRSAVSTSRHCRLAVAAGIAAFFGKSCWHKDQYEML